MGDRGLFDLYQLFNAENGEDATPDWDESLANVKEAIAQLKEYSNSPEAKYSVFDMSTYQIREDSWCEDNNDALNRFMKQIESHKDDTFFGDNGYSNALGEFFPKGMNVYAILRGKRFNSNSIYVVTDSAGLDWYLNALEIVQETIEFVLAQPDPQNYYLVWSG
jgi:hypothetical protein